MAGSSRIRLVLGAALCGLFLVPQGSQALDALNFTVQNAPPGLERALRGVSGLVAARAEGRTEALDLLTEARAEYGRLLGALYEAGHYSAVIHVRIDGREAAEIPALEPPDSISTIEVVVTPGPVFTFADTQIAPLAPGTELPDDFRPGRVAGSPVLTEAVDGAVTGWRAFGFAKAGVSSQSLVADHPAATLSADIVIDSGPQLRFGPLTIAGEERMTERRINQIADLPKGTVYDPEEVARAVERLRRTGVFSSVSVVEDEAVTDPDLLGLTLNVLEAKPRRYSIGAEVASFEGLSVTAEWLHRNLFGGGERLVLDGAITNIGAETSGEDYALGLSLERPATTGRDTDLAFSIGWQDIDDVDYTARLAETQVGFTQYFDNGVVARAGIGYEYAKGADEVGSFYYRSLTLPLGATLDRRDNPADARRGFYVDAEVKPFRGLGTTDNGARATADLRVYRGLTETGGFVLAGRLQGGLVLGSSLLGTPRDDLFYSGGGGTVRGQPYQSLGVKVLRGAEELQLGGNLFLGASVEGRVKITERIGAVAFFDAGLVGAGGLDLGAADFHSGAGLGLRYETGLGPIRFDIAGPVGGNTGDGIQLYVGIGQAF